MQLTDGYRAAPGCCAVCKTASTELPVVDLELADPGVIVRVARVYLCGHCAMQAASLVAPQMSRAIVDSDFKTAYADVVEELTNEQERYAATAAELEELRSVINRAARVVS